MITQGDNMKFKRIYIEITNTCNLSCQFCIQNQRVPRIMHVEEFRHVLNEIQPYTDYVYLHILGEPLSHPQIKEILQCCQERNIYVNLTTNGTLLKQQKEVLCTSGIRQVNISLHSFPEHEQRQYLQDVLTTGELIAASGTHVNYRLWSIQENGQLSEETMQLLHYVKEHYNVIVTEEPKRMQRLELGDHLHLHFEDVFAWPSLEVNKISERGRCLGMKTMCGILSNGDVVPCCLDSKGDVCLGNIFKQPFLEIIQSERVKQMLEGFEKQRLVEPLCQHCGYRTRFN